MAGFSREEAKRIAAEHQQSPDVRDAHPVTFAGVTHVHLDLEDGNIVVFGPDDEDAFDTGGGALEIEGEWYEEEPEQKPWWKIW